MTEPPRNRQQLIGAGPRSTIERLDRFGGAARADQDVEAWRVRAATET